MSKPEPDAKSNDKCLAFFDVDNEDEDSDNATESDSSSKFRDSDKSDSETEAEKISAEDAELVLDEYRSARTSGLPPPSVMFAASKKPNFLKASNVPSKWDGEKQLSDLRNERARKAANPDVITSAAKKKDDWDEVPNQKPKRFKKS